MKRVFISFLLIIAITITGCSTEASDDPNAKFVKGENGDWIFNFTADEFVDEWINDPFFKGTDFEVGSDETTSWMIDKENNAHIIVFKDSKKSKASGFCVAVDYEMTVDQNFLMVVYTLKILGYLNNDENPFANDSVYEQINEAQDAVAAHKKDKVSFEIGDYIYSVYAEGNKAIAALIIPRPDINQK